MAAGVGVEGDYSLDAGAVAPAVGRRGGCVSVKVRVWDARVAVGGEQLRASGASEAGADGRWVNGDAQEAVVGLN